jgi:hypothetical protein
VSDREHLKAVLDLQKSLGWKVLADVMNQEVVAAAMAIADNPKMTLDEINFRRGTIWAAKQLMDLPIKIQLKLENDLALSTKDDKPKLQRA